MRKTNLLENEKMPVWSKTRRKGGIAGCWLLVVWKKLRTNNQQPTTSNQTHTFARQNKSIHT